MELRDLCTNCMMGSIERRICSFCGKPADWETDRPAIALPARYTLGGQYYLGKVIGYGGFGITYLAWDVNNNARVAVKELFPNKDVTREKNGCTVRVVFGQEEYVDHIKKRFLEEAQSLYVFSAETDIINVYRLFEENHTAYYSMEYLDGMDLKTALKKNGKMPWERLSAYMYMIIAALRALHEKNLIHRDISPDNIFLTRNGRAKLIDFGSLRSYNNPNGLTTILKHNFAPYEQYRTNGNQGPWTDIYSLCVTMYYALSGVLPPKAPDRIMSDKTVLIKNYCPSLPDNVVQAIHKGMSIMPEDRYQTVDELAAQLFGAVRPNFVQGNAKRQSTPVQEVQYPVIIFQGTLNGKRWYLRRGEAYVVGRDTSCNIQFPTTTPGISRRQCMIYMDEYNKVWCRDENSSYGTFLNQQRLTPGQWYEIRSGYVISFGQEKLKLIWEVQR